MGPELSWGQSGRVRTLVPGHTLGPEVVELQGSSPARIRGLCGLCPLGSGCPAPACSPPPCSLHHPWPCFPAVCSRLVFPHHAHHGVLCISALSKDPEAQFCVSLLQLPHRCGTSTKALGKAWGGAQRWVGGRGEGGWSL